jgi:hypothetical protein
MRILELFLSDERGGKVRKGIRKVLQKVPQKHTATEKAPEYLTGRKLSGGNPPATSDGITRRYRFSLDARPVNQKI